MKNIKKMLCLVICLTVFAVMAGKTDRAAAAAPSGTYEVSYLSSTLTSAGISLNIGSYAEVALWDSSYNLVQSTRAYSYASFNGLKKNKVYYYSVRGLAYSSGTYVAATDWAPYKAFTTANVKVNLTSKKSRTVKFKFPKVTGIKSYTLYMSTKQNSGYKKLKVVKPGKTYTISKFKKKSFAYYKNYYYKITPKLKSGVTASTYTGYFYIKKTFA